MKRASKPPWSSLKAMAAVLAAATLSPLLVQSTPPWPSSYWDIPGDYCRAKYPEGRCCLGRKDPCSVPILGTLCYCDTFCNRTSNSDCCPDYFTHCEGLQRGEGGPPSTPGQLALKPTLPPKREEDDEDLQYVEGAPEETVFFPPEEETDEECPQGRVSKDGASRCFADGRAYTTRDTVQKNCNTCRCQVSLRNPRCMELLCESDPCLVDERKAGELMEGWESGQYSWEPSSNYSFFWGRTLREGVRGRLGTFAPGEPVRDMTAMKFRYSPSELPAEFDARDKWPGKIQGVSDQGWCGASWAFSTSGVASDRFGVEGESGEGMSAQALISCDTEGQAGCRGGHVDRAWNYLRRFGTVPESCYPFASGSGYGGDSDSSGVGDPAGSCKIPRSHHLDVARALGGSCPQLLERRRLFKTQPAYRVGRRNTSRLPRRREQDIMYEILTRGPVQALMKVPSDFFLYKSGVYRRTNLAEPYDGEETSGFHSVRVLGWGDEEGEPYWLCANSWGTEWGEEGLFRIARGSNECQIEDFVVGVWAQTEEHKRRKMQRRRRRLRRMRRRRHHGQRKSNNNRRRGGGNSQKNTIQEERKKDKGEDDTIMHYQVG